jgi:hypothetical protein
MLNRLFITLILNETLLSQQKELLINYIYLGVITRLKNVKTVLNSFDISV